MAKKMEENITCQFEEGSSMFSLDFASKGLSWAGNVYQKWENMCRDNVMVQESSKLVDAVGEQVRKIYEEVADEWLNPFSLGSGSDVSLEQDIISAVCQKSKASHDEKAVNVGSSTSPMSALTISSEEVSIASLADIWQDERGETCDMLVSNPAEANRCSCSNSSMSASDSGSLPSAGGVSLSEHSENMVEKGFTPSHFTDPSEDAGNSGSQDVISLVRSFSTVLGQRSNSSEHEASLSVTDIGAESSNFFNEQIAEYSLTVDKHLEINDEFEDVSLEDLFVEKRQDDYLDEAENYELALISYRAMKNRSYKKKLRDAFTSSFYSLKKKNNEREAGFCHDADADLAKGGITTASAVSGKVLDASNLSTIESCESDWELL